MLNIIRRTSTVHTSVRKSKIKYIVIHYTAGLSSKVGSARNTAAFFARPTSQGGRDASADFIVDDMEIVQYNPDLTGRNCWHCGGKKQGSKGASHYNICNNSNSIGIEICSTNTTKPSAGANDKAWSLSDAAVKNAVELTKYLMAAFNVPPENVIRHYDVTGKACPGVVGWNGYTNESAWNAFKSSIKGENKPADKSTEGGTNNGYLVRITADFLYVRRQPSAKADKVTIVNHNQVFTIVGIDHNWGQLKSGLGWINLNYTEVVRK